MSADNRTVHTDALATLGTILGPNEKRDAIHIAVEPVIAGHHLLPGAEVGRLPDGTYSPVADKIVGIVDPFIDGRVNKGERFWLLLMPRTVTSLRHVWEHPDFPDDAGKQVTARRVKPAPVKALEPVEAALTSKEWIEQFASSIRQSYEDLMAAADRWVEREDYTYDNSESYKGHYEKFREFWPHWAVVTGREMPREPHAFFTCGC